MWSVGALPTSVENEEARESGLLAVDAHVCEAQARGVLSLRAPSAEIAAAVERHVIRRAATTHRVVVRVSKETADSCWRDACAQLGVGRVPADPVAAAHTFNEAAQQAIVVLLGDLPEGSWDHAVLQVLEGFPTQALIVLVRWGETENPFGHPHEIRIGGTREDFESWWGGVVQEALVREEGGTIADLDDWWAWSSRRMDSVPEPDLASLSADGLGLVTRLRLTGRAWPMRFREVIGPAAAWEELARLDLIVQHAGYFRLSPSASAIVKEPTDQDLRHVADTLRTRYAQEPWALARAGVLYTRAGEREHGETCLELALRALDDVLARHEVWDGWSKALGKTQGEQRRLGALFAAELALERDDVDVSLELAHLAGGGDASAPFRAHYVLGRAQLARGDMVAARGSLERAFARSSTDDERASALAQLAEVSYVVGDLEDASRKAREARLQAKTIVVQLDASNTLGKVLLARAQWLEAEAHFSDDESAAAAAGLELAQLRARVNRAIALLSKGQGEPARSILESVLDDARRRHDQRAAAFALSNLAVLAIERHDHAQALSLSEAAIDARRRLGDKVGLSRVVTNLAELRLRLGLVAEAEQTLAFGRHALRTGVPPTRAAHFALVAARIRLAQGDTFEASREIASALSMVDGSSDGAMVGECYRVEARIGLEDGDVNRARCAIREAEARADESFALAEVGLLQAKLAQAAGQDAMSLAHDALMAVRKSNDQELLREANVLLAELYRIEGRHGSALRYIDAAKQVRDRVVESLPSALRPRYLSRRDLQRLADVDDALRMTAMEVAPSETEPASRRTPRETHSRFVGHHASVTRLLGVVEKVARSSSPVLVFGESGTGKELIAEALHRQSDRHAGPLIKVNCAALVDTLLLSELFGHEKGAFTGAASRRRGRFELADGGTLFLDEIGDISARTQVALLRVLQDNTFERVGGGMSLRSDVRVVCATHRNLQQMVADGTFREDLYYRLSGVTLRVPALRDRMSDLAELAKHLLEEVARERSERPKRLTPEALAILQRHRWPGNVRELDNVLRAASLFSETEDLSVEAILEHVPVRAEAFSTPSLGLEALPSSSPPPTGGDQATPDTLRLAYDEIRTQGTSLSDLKRNIERECIRQALADSDGNITRAAMLLGMKRPRLSQLVKQYCLLDSSWEDAS